MYSGGGAARTPGKGGDKGGKRGRSGEDPCLPRGYEWSHTHRSAQQGGAGGVRAEGAAGAAAGVAAGIAGLGDSPSVATGDFAACRAAALAVLQPDAPCAFDRCGAAGAYTPRLRGSFLASENFHYTARALTHHPHPRFPSPVGSSRTQGSRCVTSLRLTKASRPPLRLPSPPR